MELLMAIVASFWGMVSYNWVFTGVIVILYLVVLFGAFLATSSIFGDESTAMKLMMCTLGLPVVLTIYIKLLIPTVISTVLFWPVRYRSRRLLKRQIKGLSFSRGKRTVNQHLVNFALNEKARKLSVLCGQQVEAFQREGDTAQVWEGISSIALAKRDFWQLHRLAARSGFYVWKSWKDYLSFGVSFDAYWAYWTNQC